MWPSALQMTREECRGVLRRLELESYSNVISAFRAQGGLNDIKIKILDDLRNVFHISQDRHRAESRRVANDEQLSTIAEAISGPNTYQEWCKEGKRSYPLLPRTTPETALSIVANNVAEEVAKQNSQLPYPANTVNLKQTSTGTFIKVEDFKSDVGIDSIFKKPLVKSDPNCMPLKVLSVKKQLKRNCNDTTNKGSKIRKEDKVHIESEKEISSSKYVTNSKIRMLYNNHSKTQSKHKKSSKKTTLAPIKRVNKNLAKAVPIKSIKRNDGDQTEETLKSEQKSSLNQQNLQKTSQLPSTSGLNVVPLESSITKAAVERGSPVLDKSPQIATSKKDISKNLSKLNLPLHNVVQGKVHNMHINEFESKTDKFATPVKKYIVEDRKPVSLAVNTIDNTKIKSVTTVISSPPIANSKVTNLKTIKPSSDQCSTPPQVFNVVDPTLVPLPLPVQHMSPTIINLNKTEQNDSSRKVLTTKLVPRILSGSRNEISTNVNKDLKNLPSTNVNQNVFTKQSPVKSNSTNLSGNERVSLNNHQLISPIRLPTGIQLKNVQNRRSVKIFSSSNGEMFLQSANSKTVGKMSPVVNQNCNLSLNNSSTQPTNSGRIAFRKVHIIPPPSNTTNKTTTIGSVKTLSITNPNMVFVNSNVTSGSCLGSSTGSGTIVKNIPIVKTNKISSVLPTTNNINDSVSVSNSGNLPKGQNVVVIGSMSGGQQSKPNIFSNIKVVKTNSSESNMITEDTPVDILNTPIIVEDNLSPAPIGSPTNKLTRQSNASPSQKVKSNQLKKIEGRKKIEILENIRIMPNRNIFEKRIENVPINNLSISIMGRNNEYPTTVNPNPTVVLGETDWEVELDQEANKSRELNAQKQSSKYNESDESFTIVEGKTNDNINDLIEEEDTIIIDDSDDLSNNVNDLIQYDESYDSVNDEIIDDNMAIEYVRSGDLIFENKIDSTSKDQGYTIFNDNNVMILTHPLHDDKKESVSQINQILQMKKKGSKIISVEEISSTSHVGYVDEKNF